MNAETDITRQDFGQLMHEEMQRIDDFSRVVNTHHHETSWLNGWLYVRDDTAWVVYTVLLVMLVLLFNMTFQERAGRAVDRLVLWLALEAVFLSAAALDTSTAFLGWVLGEEKT